MKNDSLGDRMKMYEGRSRTYLERKVPAIIRIDGKAFHTFTKGMKRPFDEVITKTMQETMKYLCENIQGCVLGYTQSDEITLVLTDYATPETDAWFSYGVQKMCSVAASMATLSFNSAFRNIVRDLEDEWLTHIDYTPETHERADLWGVYHRKLDRALFDARVFTLAKDEVCNCLIWRQQDAIRNSIEAVGHANFSQRQLHGKPCTVIKEMLVNEKGIDWNDYKTDWKRGSCCRRIRTSEEIDDPRNPGNRITVERNKWIIDHEIPIFTQDRDYIERLL